jgi:hypothetical protein
MFSGHMSVSGFSSMLISARTVRQWIYRYYLIACLYSAVYGAGHWWDVVVVWLAAHLVAAVVDRLICRNWLPIYFDVSY